MHTITLRKEFSTLEEFTAKLPQTFDGQGTIIHNGRNVIRKIETDQGVFVVKNFKGMYFFNRLAYSLFRESKAARSYHYSDILNERGIATPSHVAWIDCYAAGLLTRSYFVSVFSPHQTLKGTIQYLESNDPQRKKALLMHLADFVRKLHSLGIYHEDLSPGNILVAPTSKGFDFELVDLNRIKFRKVKYSEGLRNFATLALSRDDLNFIISEYARLMDENPAAAVTVFRKYEIRRTSLLMLRRKIKYYTITQVEKIWKGSHAL